MDKQFDELSKSLAEGVSRREALRKFGVGLAGVLLAALGSSVHGKAQPATNVYCWNCVNKNGYGYNVCSPSKPTPRGYKCTKAPCGECAQYGVTCPGCLQP